MYFGKLRFLISVRQRYNLRQVRRPDSVWPNAIFEIMGTGNIGKILQLLALLQALPSHAQNQGRAWLPEKYVKAISHGDTSAYKNLQLFTGFMFDSKGKLSMMTYGGETNPVRTQKVLIGGKVKFQLLGVKYHINLMYNSRRIMDSIAQATAYFSQSGNTAILEVVGGNQRDEYVFVDHDGDYRFRDIRESLFRLRNKYNIHNGPEPIKIER